MSKIALFLVGFVLLVSSNASAEIYSTISGYVIEAGTGKPVAGQTVSAVKMDGTKTFVVEGITNVNGLYVLNNIIKGTYSVSLKKSAEYYTDKRTVEVTVPLAKNIVNNNFRVKKAGYVSGRVLKSDGVTPYVNVSVIADVPQGGYQLLGRTDATGFYKIGGLPDSEKAVVMAMVPGAGVKYKENIKIVGGQETKNADIVVLKDASNISIKGRVLSEALNAPLANVVILILGKGSFAETATDANGNFEVYGLPPGIYDVMIAQARYEFFSQKGLEIKAGAPPLEIDFILKPLSGGQSKINSPVAPSLLGSLVVRLLSLDFGLVGEAYAADACEVCVSCSSPEFDKLVANYKKNAAQYPESSIFDPFADAQVCVSDDLRNSCKDFNSPTWLFNSMQCIQEKALAHDSACWTTAATACVIADAASSNYSQKVIARTACTTAQALCETLDRNFCFDKYPPTEDDYDTAFDSVFRCIPSIAGDILW